MLQLEQHRPSLCHPVWTSSLQSTNLCKQLQQKAGLKAEQTFESDKVDVSQHDVAPQLTNDMAYLLTLMIWQICLLR